VAHKLAGWPLLKLYYSAFFAAHAITRSQGSGVVKLEKRQTAHLNSILSLIAPEASGISPGMFVYKTMQSTETGRLSVIMEPARTDGGVHESFWKHFCEFL